MGEKNPFNDKDSKMSTGSSQLSKHDEGVAARTEKQLKGKARNATGEPDWDKVDDTHHSVKDNGRGRRK